MKLSDLTPDKVAQTVLVYGPPKSGKTLLVGELASKYNSCGLIWRMVFLHY